MIEYISQIFDYLVKEKEYIKRIDDITYVVKNLIYSKDNIEIIFTCELMENCFDFEIYFCLDENCYSVCEQIGQRRIHYQNISKDIIHQSIFNYTISKWDFYSFQSEKEKINRKNYIIKRSKKIFRDNVELYGLLLKTAIESIENILYK